MSLNTHSIATKGILGGVPGTKGFVFVGIEQGEVGAGGIFFGKSGAGVQSPKEAKKWVKIKFKYDEKTWEQTLFIDDNVKVEMDNVKIDFHEDFTKSEISEVDLEYIENSIDVKLVGFEHEVNVLKPKITIEL